MATLGSVCLNSMLTWGLCAKTVESSACSAETGMYLNYI